MKPALLIAMAFVTVSSLPFVSHRDRAAAPESVVAGALTRRGANVHSTSVQANGSVSTSANAEMRPGNAELVGKLDAKSAGTVPESPLPKSHSTQVGATPDERRPCTHLAGYSCTGSAVGQVTPSSQKQK